MLLDKTNWFTLEGVNFESNKDVMKPGAEKTLDNLFEMLNCYNTINIKMGGYTDNSGDSVQNVALSLQRAKAAMGYLVKKGIPANRIEVEGYGPQHPICAGNADDACKAQNRRIDIRVTKLK